MTRIYPDLSGYAYMSFPERHHTKINFQPFANTTGDMTNTQASDENPRVFHGDVYNMKLNEIAVTDDSQLLVGRGLRSLHVWEAQTGVYKGSIQGHPGLISDSALIGDRIVCVYHRQGVIKIWNLDQACIHQPDWLGIPQTREGFESFTEDESYIVANLTNALHPRLLERFQSGVLPWRLPNELILTSSNPPTFSHISRNGRYLGILSAKRDPQERSELVTTARTARYYDLWSGGKKVFEQDLAPARFKPKWAQVAGLQGFPTFLDENRVIMPEPEGLELWELDQGTRFPLPIPCELVGGHNYRGKGIVQPRIALHRDKILYSTWNEEGGATLSLWDLNKRQVAKNLVTNLKEDFHVSLEPRGVRATIAAGRVAELMIVNLDEDEPVSALKLDYDAVKTKAWYSPNGRNILAISKTAHTDDYNGPSGTLWLAENGRRLVAMNRLPSGEPHRDPDDLFFSPDGNQIFLWPVRGDTLYELTVPTLAEIDAEIDQRLAQRR